MQLFRQEKLRRVHIGRGTVIVERLYEREVRVIQSWNRSFEEEEQR